MFIELGCWFHSRVCMKMESKKMTRSRECFKSRSTQPNFTYTERHSILTFDF